MVARPVYRTKIPKSYTVKSWFQLKCAYFTSKCTKPPTSKSLSFLGICISMKCGIDRPLPGMIILCFSHSSLSILTSYFILTIFFSLIPLYYTFFQFLLRFILYVSFFILCTTNHDFSELACTCNSLFWPLTCKKKCFLIISQKTPLINRDNSSVFYFCHLYLAKRDNSIQEFFPHIFQRKHLDFPLTNCDNRQM